MPWGAVVTGADGAGFDLGSADAGCDLSFSGVGELDAFV